MMGKWPEPDKGLNDEQQKAANDLVAALRNAQRVGLYVFAFEEGLFIDRSRCEADTEHWELDMDVLPASPGYVYRLSPEQEKLAGMFELLKSLLGKE